MEWRKLSPISLHEKAETRLCNSAFLKSQYEIP
jgi:hypothetical protein